MIGISRGMLEMPGKAVCIPNAGSARITSTPAEATAETSGRRSTRSRMAPQKRESPSLRLRRCRKGILPFSTRSPSQERRAGSTVSEPATAMATTMIVPTAIEVQIAVPPKKSPASAMMTVRPEMRTARPDVAAAASSAAAGPLPAARSSRSRLR